MFFQTVKQLTANDIKEIEAKLEFDLPKQLVEHYLKFNGGIPEKTFFILLSRI